LKVIQIMKLIAAFLIFLFLYPERARSQLCTGSLGDPVVHITFGTGTDPGPPLPKGITTYNYIQEGCPADGSYTIRQLTFNCFDNTWFSLAGDHTPDDAGGYYMLVNASEVPGDFYVETIRGLCSNTNYEFATWVMNVLRPSACNGQGIDPNLTFSIETTNGIVLATKTSGNIPEGNAAIWKQYGLFFQTPAGITDVVVRIRNNSPGGCGNDLALDDITFRPCGPTVNATVTGRSGDKITVCEGSNESFVLNGGYAGGYNNPQFQWQVSSNGGQNWIDLDNGNASSYTRSPTKTGIYYYRMLIAEAGNFNISQCRIASNTVIISVDMLPFVQATNYVLGCFGTDVILYAAGGTKFLWTGPNGFTSTKQRPVLPKIKFTDAGLYKVIVSSDIGCSNSDSTNLVVYPAVTAGINPETSVCEGTPVQLQATGGTRYKWVPSLGLSDDGISNPTAKPKDSTVYTVYIINENGCFDSISTKVHIWQKPVANAGPDKKTRLGMPVRLNGSITGTNVSFFWTSSSFLTATSVLQPYTNSPQDITYTLQVISNLGCGSNSDDVKVKVYEKLIIPNAFSPNGDGINDSWIVEPLDLFTESVTEVYNRYGQLVYRSNGYSRPWDGTRNGVPLPVGNYYYVIDLKNNNEPKLTGSIMILR